MRKIKWLKWRLGSAAWLVAAAVAGPVLAQSGGSGGVGPLERGNIGQPAGSQLLAADRAFLIKAATSNMFEIEAARLAAEKAVDPAVKSYAAMLAEQHSAVQQELNSLASAKGIKPPSSLPGSQKRALQRLSAQSGPAFDVAFVREVGTRDHQADIKLFQSASRTAKDPEVKAWAAKTLPVLQQQLAEAQKLPMAGRGMGMGMGMGGPGDSSGRNASSSDSTSVDSAVR